MDSYLQAYKPEETLIGYEPFDRKQNEFIICVTEKGRDEVMNKLQQMRETYQKKCNSQKLSWQENGYPMEVKWKLMISYSEIKGVL